MECLSGCLFGCSQGFACFESSYDGKGEMRCFDGLMYLGLAKLWPFLSGEMKIVVGLGRLPIASLPSVLVWTDLE